MLNRAFTKREKVLLLVLVMILLGLVYYRFVRLPVQERIATADTTVLEIRMDLETEVTRTAASSRTSSSAPIPIRCSSMQTSRTRRSAAA